MYLFIYFFVRKDPDIDVVPPLTLTSLLLADKDQSGTLDDKKNGKIKNNT